MCEFVFETHSIFYRYNLVNILCNVCCLLNFPIYGKVGYCECGNQMGDASFTNVATVLNVA